MIDSVEASLVISVIALGLSTISLVLSMFTLRRQGIPDKYEVQRRIMEELSQTYPDRRLESHHGPVFEFTYITVIREANLTTLSGLANLAKEYITGELQGRTAVGFKIKNGDFSEDFNGELSFSSETHDNVKIQVGPENGPSWLKEVTFRTASAGDVTSYMMWLCSDEFPEYVSLDS